MANFFHILSVRPTLSEQEQDPFMNIMDAAIDWREYHTNCYLLYSEKPGSYWNTILGPLHTHPNSKFLVCKLEINELGGRMENSLWSWIRSMQALDVYTLGDNVFVWVDKEPIERVYEGTIIGFGPTGQPRVQINGVPLRFHENGRVKISKIKPKFQSSSERLISQAIKGADFSNK